MSAADPDRADLVPILHHREMIAAFRMRDAAWTASIMTSHIRAAYHAFLTTVPADDPDHKRLDT
jgi:DNA-binding GntR family transcriptional regulator